MIVLGGRATALTSTGPLRRSPAAIGAISLSRHLLSMTMNKSQQARGLRQCKCSVLPRVSASTRCAEFLDRCDRQHRCRDLTASAG